VKWGWWGYGLLDVVERGEKGLCGENCVEVLFHDMAYLDTKKPLVEDATSE